MLPWRVKFCGLKRAEDIDLAAELGVWAVGFVLTKSCRQVTLADCRALCAHVPSTMRRIGVMTTEPPEAVRRAVETCGLDAVQIHAEHDRATWETFADLPVIPVLRMANAASLQRLADLPGDCILLDAAVGAEAGGTGKAFDWSLSRGIPATRAVILAGGLTPQTVADAIQTVHPWAVDVSSGIESERGVKSPDRMRAFAAAVAAMAPSAEKSVDCVIHMPRVFSRRQT